MDPTGKKSARVALGGVFSALCLVLMFMTGLVPFATYALPALSGAMLIAVVVENGRKTAILVYISVAALSFFVVPDREAALMFAALFGYYPIAKEGLERIKSRVLEYAAKLALFNVAVVGGYILAMYALGLGDLLSGMDDFGRYTGLILLAAGNAVFIMYDYALTRYITVYIKWFRPRFLRR
jgi:hypothetical protein